MRKLTLIGLVFIVFGVGALISKGVTYTTREKIIDIGSVEASANVRKSIPLSPILGGISLAGGVVLVIIGRRKQ